MLNKKVIFTSILILVLLSFLFFEAKADVVEINLKNSPPCLLTNEFGECQNPASLEGYINLIFRFALGIGGFLAVLMIVIGAILLSVSGSVDKAREGKDYIQSALLGLALLMGTYLILKTINPALVILTPPTAPPIKLEAPTRSTANGISTAADYARDYPELCVEYKINYSDSRYLDTQQAITSHKNNYQQLNRVGVSLSASRQVLNASTGKIESCTWLCEEGCSSLAAMPDEAIKFIIDIKKNCLCDVVITGGTEIGHQTHRPYKPIFDLRDNENLAKYILGNIDTLRAAGLSFINISASMNTKYMTNGKTFCQYVKEKGVSCSTTEQNNHFHIKLGS